MAAKDDVNVDLISEMVKRRRGNVSLRTTADEIGVSAPTLQRIEAKQIPNSTNLVKIAEWLGVSVDDFRTSKKEQRQKNTVEQIEIYLRADPDLDKEAAATIANVVKQVYDGFKKAKKKKG